MTRCHPNSHLDHHPPAMRAGAEQTAEPGSAPRVGDELRHHLPTPVRRLQLPTGESLWLKDDGRTGSFYGGNKLRKLACWFDVLRTRRIRRIWTVGAAGSHHVLATAYYARAEGLPVSAWLLPQPDTPHVREVLRALAASGAELIPLRAATRSPVGASHWPRRLGAALPRGNLWLGPGAIGAIGSSGYVAAARELAEQVRSGELPEPGRLVVAAGTGGTAAGLLAGLEQTELDTRVVAVAVTNPRISRSLILAQAIAVLRRIGARVELARLARRLELRVDFLGAGYGCDTPASTEALALGHELGLELEHTYTAKAFAAAAKLSKDAAERGEQVLYWQTLSQRPMHRLLRTAPPVERLPASLTSLLLPRSP